MSPWLWVVVGIAALLLLAALYYWLIVITEGVYLGPRLVVLLYDRFAPKYEETKSFDPELERQYLGYPIFARMADFDEPHVLDVAAGTGRLARVFSAETFFNGTIYNMDAAWQMLAAGKPLLPATERVHWMQGHADRLPFADEQFDVVTCLEALEFFPSTPEAVAEMIRTLRPGGLLVATRRKGWEARAFIGRYYSAEQFEELLRGYGLINVTTDLWQVDYDLVMGVKPEAYK